MLNFAPGSSTLAPSEAPAAAREFAADVLKISLVGQIGKNDPVSLQSVRRKIAGRGFAHLHIDISSRGGDSGEAFAIYETLRAVPAPVSVRATGQCLSAAMVVFMAGELRIASANTEFLIHPASLARESMPERVTNQILRERADRLAVVDERVAALFSGRTGSPMEWFANESLTEDPLAVSDAIESGVVHEFDGLTQTVDHRWPEYAAQNAGRGVYYPSRLFTANYLTACRCVASLYRQAQA